MTIYIYISKVNYFMEYFNSCWIIKKNSMRKFQRIVVFDCEFNYVVDVGKHHTIENTLIIDQTTSNVCGLRCAAKMPRVNSWSIMFIHLWVISLKYVQ